MLKRLVMLRCNAALFDTHFGAAAILPVGIFLTSTALTIFSQL